MDAASPLYAALGVIESDALNDLALWFDGRAGPRSTAQTFDRPSGDPSARAAGREG